MTKQEDILRDFVRIVRKLIRKDEGDEVDNEIVISNYVTELVGLGISESTINANIEMVKSELLIN